MGIYHFRQIADIAIVAATLLCSTLAAATGWEYVENDDPINDVKTHLVYKSGESLNYKVDKKPSILFRCYKMNPDNILAISIDWTKVVSSPTRGFSIVQFRVDKEPIVETIQIPKVEGKITAAYSFGYSADVLYGLIDDMMTAKVVYARIPDYKGSRYDFKVDMAGFAEAIKPVMESCPRPSEKNEIPT